MDTRLRLPDALIHEAMQLLQCDSPNEAVVFALRELVRREQAVELNALTNKLEIELDSPRRRRPRASKRIKA